MAEYWNFVEEYEGRTKQFLENPPEPEMNLDFEVHEKDFINSGKASAEIKLFLKRLAVDPKVLRRVAIASYEAEINVTAHSRGGKIICNIFPELVRIRFEDKGPGLEDIEKAMTPGYSTADDLVREMGFGAGLGLPNIKKNTDFMHIESSKGESTILEIIVFFS